VVNLPVAVPANLLRDGVSAAGVGGALLGVGPLEHGFCNRTAQFGIDLGERRGHGLGTEATRLTLD